MSRLLSGWSAKTSPPAFVVLRRCLVVALAIVVLVGYRSPPAHAAPKGGKTAAKGAAGATPARSPSKAKVKVGAAAKTPASPPSKGNVVVFAFKGEGAESVHAQVVQVLRTKGLNVTTGLRPLDSAEQYRDMAVTLGLAAYVHGEVIDDGDRAKVTVNVRSGYTGMRVASARFSGDSNRLPADVGRGLWGAVGGAFTRACVAATRPRKHERAPMRIEAGTPIEGS